MNISATVNWIERRKKKHFKTAHNNAQKNLKILKIKKNDAEISAIYEQTISYTLIYSYCNFFGRKAALRGATKSGVFLPATLKK